MNHLEILSLDNQTRIELWQHLVETIEAYIARVPQARVAPALDPEKTRSLLSPLNFTQPLDPREAVDFVVRSLWDYQVHTPHPRYFGLFNPAPTTMGIAADTLVAAFNPQLGAWSHNPFAVEVEQHLIRTFACQFGYDLAATDGTFTSGGAEANHTALLTALVHTFPEFARKGLRGLDKQPVLYISTQSHHSLIKAARACGLGSDAVQQIPVDDTLQMNVEALAGQIAQDKVAELAPFLVVATAGTTNAGVVDPIARIAEVAAREKLWFHVDAAWGGAAVFVTELRNLLEGIERSDSITFDAHKWLSVPMGAGLYLTRHRGILGQTFHITTDYMPTDARGLNVIDPYTHSIQWSRRFIGLKVFLSLMVAGWDGYSTVIRHQTAMGDLLRRELETSGWEVVNRTKLPVVCFVDRRDPEGKSVAFIEAVAREIVSSGEAWISTTRLNKDLPVLRACITNYRTEPEDILALVRALNKARQKFYGGA
jgi:glutamate/tyrosine decarboxylase-like PLP-dependent enzyme